MSPRRRKAWAAIALAAGLSAAPPAAPGESVLLAGNDYAAWLALGTTGEYELLAKPINLSWESPWGKGVGKVTAIAPVRASAVVFFAQGGLVKYYLDQGETHAGARPPLEMWPEGVSALAACGAESGNADSVLVLINRPVVHVASRPASTTSPRASAPATAGGKAPASRPATRSGLTAQTIPSGRELALLRYANDRWEEVGVVPVDLPPPPLPVFLAASRHAAYVLLDRAPTVLLVLEDGQWRTLPLPDDLKGARVLALAALDRGLALAAYNAGAPGRVLITAREAGQWLPAQAVRYGGEPVDWPDAPAGSRLGQRLAFAWREGRSLVFGTCGADGDLNRQSVPAFENEKAAAVTRALNFQEVFFWGVLVLIVLLMFWPGQAPALGPLVLPPHIVVARLPRRAMAFLADFIPLSVAVFSLMGDGDFQSALEGAKQGSPPGWLIYASMISLAAYTLYCVLMEYRYGATLGKMALRLAVVTDAGRKPSLRQAALRNLAKIPELRAAAYPWTVILLLFPLFTRYRQRLGDKIARTAVIDVQTSQPAETPSTDRPPDDRGGEGPEDDSA